VTPSFLVAAVALLAAMGVLSALSRSLVAVSESSLERELEVRGRLARGRWILGRLAQVGWAVDFARTAGRIGFAVIVVALVVGLEDPLTPGRLAAAWALAVAALWILTTVAAGALARHAPERTIATFLPTLRILYVVLAPFRAVADAVDGMVARMVGSPGAEERAEEDLVSAIEDTQRQGAIDERAAAILENAVAFGDRTVGSAMTPRPAIEGIAYTDDLAEIRDFARRSGHSRIPVHRGGLDRIEGILYVKDLVPFVGTSAEGFRLRPLLRVPLRIPESKPLMEQLREFQHSKVHFAVVVDEFGGTAGILTIEDVLEELVGEIRDEHEPAEEGGPELRPGPDGAVDASGRLPVADLNAALGCGIPEDDAYGTLAGFVISHLGAIPRAGDSFTAHGVRFEVLEASPTAVRRVRARPAAGG
jgi:CBS domain containing-hemolysin-like protein